MAERRTNKPRPKPKAKAEEVEEVVEVPVVDEDVPETDVTVETVEDAPETAEEAEVVPEASDEAETPGDGQDGAEDGAPVVSDGRREATIGVAAFVYIEGGMSKSAEKGTTVLLSEAAYKRGVELDAFI